AGGLLWGRGLSVVRGVWWLLEGEPYGLVRLGVVEWMMMSLNPMLLPPICRVTSVVPTDSALSCGGLVPSGTDCGWVRFAVVAPWQLTSVNVAAPVPAATSDG